MSVNSRLPILSGTRKLFHRRDEPVHMEALRFGFFPETFVWRGHRYEILAVEQYRNVARRRIWDAGQNCFRVHCVEGTFDLCQDIKHHTWHIDRFERR